MARVRWLVVVGGLLASMSACGEAAGSSSKCGAAVSPQTFVEEIGRNGAAVGLTVRPIRSVETTNGGCASFAADVLNVALDQFAVSLYVTSVGGADEMVQLLDAEVDAWEEITDDPIRDGRARQVEQSIRDIDGLEGATVEGRCSQIDATCRYWIGVDDWLFDVQLLYDGVLDSYDASTADGDGFVTAVAGLFGDQLK